MIEQRLLAAAYLAQPRDIGRNPCSMILSRGGANGSEDDEILSQIQP
jgi:hypothetical protein